MRNGVTSQWKSTLEDNFTAGRPALEKVGVTFVPDVTPYEHMKIRILNGGHAAIVYPATMMDIHFVHEAMENELARGFLVKLANDEIIPIVPPVPNTSLPDYFKLIERRFRNPKIADTIPRLAQDGSNRQPKFILPSTADRLARNLALVSALWCRFLTGKSDSGKDITLYETSGDRLVPAAVKAKEDPMAFLVFEDIFGEVGKSELF